MGTKTDGSHLGWNSRHITKYLVFLNYSFQRFMAKKLRAIDISLSSYPVLLYLYHAAQGAHPECTQSHLVKETGQDKGLLSRSLRALEKQGYVDIRPSDKLKISNLVSITEKGKETAVLVQSFVNEWESAYWDDPLSEDEKEACIRAMQEMAAAVLDDERK